MISGSGNDGPAAGFGLGGERRRILSQRARSSQRKRRKKKQRKRRKKRQRKKRQRQKRQKSEKAGENMNSGILFLHLFVFLLFLCVLCVLCERISSVPDL